MLSSEPLKAALLAEGKSQSKYMMEKAAGKRTRSEDPPAVGEMPYKCGKCSVFAKLTRAGACSNEQCSASQVRCLILMDAAGADDEQEDGPFDMTTNRWRRRGPPPTAKHLEHKPTAQRAASRAQRAREQLAREQP